MSMGTCGVYIRGIFSFFTLFEQVFTLCFIYPFSAYLNLLDLIKTVEFFVILQTESVVQERVGGRRCYY